jgi:predicted ATPase/class 3 adenylate cyclase/DNA-binding CsgD family transcriptional regulator
MFLVCDDPMLISMSEIDPRADALVDWSGLGVSGLLPTGTVTLLLADVEGSTRLWETQPDEMTAAFARLDNTLSELVAAHDGVRPVEQGEGDSFVVAFARASDAVASALQLQRAPLAPISLRIGLHTGEVQLRDEGNYIGPTINKTARIRNLAHGGQTVLSGVTEALIVDALPDDVWLVDLGTHELRGVVRPERVVQLCHPDLRNDFPPLQTAKSVATHNFPSQFTSFVGRGPQLADVRAMLTRSRLVTLTGAGGSGKTRLAVEAAGHFASDYADGVWYVDLAPITNPNLVPVAMARALGLPDQPGRSTVDTVLWFVRDRRLLVVLDNCEHLLDACAALVVPVLGAASGLTLLATSREPIGVPGEVTWRVPSLSVSDEAIELFTDRARLAHTSFAVTDDNIATVAEICARLDGMPLAIELAAARVRALSVVEILASLHDRFRLLTGGARTAVRRQQTLRASVDWSHELLTEAERILLRRLAVFFGGFDLDAAQAVAGTDGLQRYQVLDQLSLLVDKSLVVTENSGGATRYKLLETVRQYALEKLAESGEADATRSRHRDHFTAMAALLDAPAGNDHEQRLEQVEVEIDNLRAAFGWCRETTDTAAALALASSLQPLWIGRGRLREGPAWLDAALSDLDSQRAEVAALVRARALADKATLDAYCGSDGLEQAERALAIAREVGEPALLARALTACGFVAGLGQRVEMARGCFAEAIGLARAVDDRWRLSQILALQAQDAHIAGDLAATQAIGEEGRALADAIGDRFNSRLCRFVLGLARLRIGDSAEAVTQLGELATEAEAAHDEISRVSGLGGQSVALAWRGEVAAARTVAEKTLECGAELGGRYPVFAHVVAGIAALAAGDGAAVHELREASRRDPIVATGGTAAAQRIWNAEAALADRDLTAARSWSDEAVSTNPGWFLTVALTTRARVAIAQGEPEQAGRDAHDALQAVAEIQARSGVGDTLECLGILATDAGNHRDAARLFGAASAIRQRIGEVRFKIYDADYEVSAAMARDALGEGDFESAWAEGAALSTEEAIAYARRGHGQRKRPASGWGSLTPAERDVVRLVSEGLGNKDIAARLFVSPRTVQTHLTHVYSKLGVASRVQLVKEAAKQD